MATLHELRRQRATLAANTPAIRATLREAKAAWRSKLEELPVGEPLPDEAKPVEQRVTECENTLETHQKAIDDHDSRIAELQRSVDDDGDAAKPPPDPDDGDKTYIGQRMTPYGYGECPPMKEGKAFKMTRYAVCLLVARSNGMQAAADFAMRRFGDKDVAKALNTTGVATGGALIPQAFSTDFIELLRAITVIRTCGPMIVDMPMGNLTIPRLAAGSTAGYQGELDDMSASQQSFDDLQLNAKKLTALVPVSNDMIRRAPANIEQILRDDMLQSAARREDLAFMFGDGSGNSPIGLLNLCAAASKLAPAAFTANDNATILTAVNGVLLGMKLMLTTNFSRMIRPVFIFSPIVEAFLLGLRDQVGNFVYKDEMLNQGKLWGVPFKTTNQIATNISAPMYPSGTANDGTYMFLADFADVIIAETYNLVIDASDVAAYKDSGGNMVSTFTRDQTAFRLIMEHDFNIRHQASVAVALLPAWAPAGWTNFTSGGAYYVQAPSGDMSAAPSTWGVAAPTGSNNPGNSAAVAPGGTQPGRP